MLNFMRKMSPTIVSLMLMPSAAALAQSPELESIAVIEPLVDNSTILNNAKSVKLDSLKLIKSKIEEILKNSRRFRVYERDTAVLQKSVLLEQDFASSQRAAKDAAEFGRMNNVHFIVLPVIASIKLEADVERDQNSKFLSTTSSHITLTLKIIDTSSGGIKYQKTETFSSYDKKQLTVMSTPDYSDVWLRMLQTTGSNVGMSVFDAIFPIEIIQLNSTEAILNRGEGGGLNPSIPLSLYSVGEGMVDPKTGISLAIRMTNAARGPATYLVHDVRWALYAA